METIAAADDAQQSHSTIHPTPQKVLPDDSAHLQRLRLLERLKVAPVDTLTARRELDVMHPAARIQELKRRGHKIDTVRVGRQTDCGKVHCVVLYTLAPMNNLDWRECLQMLCERFSHLGIGS